MCKFGHCPQGPLDTVAVKSPQLDSCTSQEGMVNPQGLTVGIVSCVFSQFPLIEREEKRSKGGNPLASIIWEKTRSSVCRSLTHPKTRVCNPCGRPTEQANKGRLECEVGFSTSFMLDSDVCQQCPVYCRQKRHCFWQLAGCVRHCLNRRKR